MKMIILAAGQGTRLRPLTNDKPKCMVEYNKKPIIDYILEVAKKSKIDDISIVTGYKKDILKSYLKNKNLTFFTNKRFSSSNMVSSLFCAKEFMDDDLIISYADIIYNKEILDKLLESTNDFSVVVDRRWKELWSQRMENPLKDVETLKIKNDKITEIGKKPKNYNEVEGQYIGLIKVSKNIINDIIQFYNNLDKNSIYDGQDFDNIYMTSFIQLIVNVMNNVKPVYIDGGWVEIDCKEDLEIKEV